MDGTYPADIFTEPADVDPDTLRHLGPLRPLAGIWEGTRGKDEHPAADGPAEDPYLERLELQPIDPQTNGPQLLYGLRYHTRIVRPNEVATFHDQVGYWLWEPSTGALIHTIAIPRGQVLMASGRATAEARSFEVAAKLGAESFGICSAPFLHHAFRTVEFKLTVKVELDGTWSYEQDTVMVVRGREEPFHHIDRNTLHRVAHPTPNPMMAAGR